MSSISLRVFLLSPVRSGVVKGRGYFSVVPTTLSEVSQEKVEILRPLVDEHVIPNV